MVNDPVGDFIIRLTNAGAIKKTIVSVPFSMFKLAIAEKLKDAGYIQAVEKKGKKIKKTLDVVLKYNQNGEPQIQGVKRISKPGRRMYKSVLDIVPVRSLCIGRIFAHAGARMAGFARPELMRKGTRAA